MLFSVIYSADCPRSESIVRFQPPQARTLWDRTERQRVRVFLPGRRLGAWQASQVVWATDQDNSSGLSTPRAS